MKIKLPMTNATTYRSLSWHIGPELRRTSMLTEIRISMHPRNSLEVASVF